MSSAETQTLALSRLLETLAVTIWDYDSQQLYDAAPGSLRDQLLQALRHAAAEVDAEDAQVAQDFRGLIAALEEYLNRADIASQSLERPH